MIYLFTAGILLLLDLGIKWYVETHFTEDDTREAAGGKIMIRKSHNSGMAMNVLEDRPEVVRWLSTGLNPEVNVNGLDPGYEWFNNIYPETRRYTFGMKIQF